MRFLRLALRLARRGFGATSPNPMVGAVLVKAGKIIGRGWHRRAGAPHAEIEALRDAQRHGHSARGATLYVTLEPCCTHGRTPPCTDAIIAAGIKRVVWVATDPNPAHAGKGFKILKRAGIDVTPPVTFGVPRTAAKGNRSSSDRLKAELRTLAHECAELNEAFNHWIVRRTPFVTVKAAMTLDGKIATANGESKWITGERARAHAMRLRCGADAILVGINTVLADNPSLTVRTKMEDRNSPILKPVRRIVLDSMARTPLMANVVSDSFAALTTIVVSRRAPKHRVAALAQRVNVLVAPATKAARASVHSRINLGWLLKKLGAQNVTSLLVEGGGEVNASFLLGDLAQRIALFYAPMILGGRDSLKAVAGEGEKRLSDALNLRDIEWKRIGADLFLTARIGADQRRAGTANRSR